MWEVAWLYNHKASKESSNITNSLNKNGMYSSKLNAFGAKKKKKSKIFALHWKNNLYPWFHFFFIMSEKM